MRLIVQASKREIHKTRKIKNLLESKKWLNGFSKDSRSMKLKAIFDLNRRLNSG